MVGSFYSSLDSAGPSLVLGPSPTPLSTNTQKFPLRLYLLEATENLWLNSMHLEFF